MNMVIESLIKCYLGLRSLDEIKSQITPDLTSFILDWAHREELLPLVFPMINEDVHNLELVDHDHPEGKTPQMAYKRYLTRRPMILDDLQRLSHVCMEHGIELLYLKGFSMEPLYKNPIHRFTADIDLVVRDVAQLWPLIQSDLEIGYEHLAITTARHIKNTDQFAGLFRLEVEHLASKRGMYGPEYDVGGFTLTDISMIPADELFNGSQTIMLENDVTLHVPSFAKQILVIVGESLTRPQVKLRDVLDILILLQHTSETDLEQLNKLIFKYALQNEITRMFRKLKEIRFDLNILGSDVITNFVQHHVYQECLTNEQDRLYKGHILPYHKLRDWKENSPSDLLHYARRDRLGDRLENSEEPERYENRLIQVGKKFRNPQEQIASGHHTYLLFFGDHVSGDLEYLQKDGYYYLKTPVGIYWLSQEGLDSEESIDHALETSKQLASLISQ